MKRSRFARSQRMTIVTGILSFVIIIVVLQLWLFTSTMNAYLGGLPEPLYALFGTGYLGYTAARQWGKIAGSDR